MTLNRRTLMRGIALAPALSLANSLPAQSRDLTRSISKDTCAANILFHGLFLMEFTREGLVITAPDVEGHRYCMRNNGILTEFPPDKPVQMNLGKDSLTALLPGEITSFEHYPAIPQFSKTETKVDDLVGQKYRLRIELPFPSDVLSLRCGLLSDFSRIAEGNVRNSIKKACEKGGNHQFALVTCLRYLKRYTIASPPVATLSFYAEHMQVPTIAQTNQAYKAAGQLFSQPENFNLSIKATPPPPPVVPQDVHPGYGISSDDEFSLPELWPNSSQAAGSQIGGPLVDVGSCIQLGFH